MNHFIDAFILQAKQNPDSPAVLDCEGVYSYGELNHRSAYLAKIILDALKPGETTGRIALLLPRTKDYIAAWLGVLRAGCTAIPLSSEYPAERISTILKDAQCPLCLTTEALSEHVPGDVSTILLDKVFPEGTELPAADLDLNHSDPDAEGMIYYTSGSTGTPKGVVHQQRILDAYPVLLPQLVPLSSKTNTLCIAMFTFAASLMDLTPPLYYGGSLYIANETERKDINLLYEIMKTNRISGIFMPPTMYGTMRQIFGVLPVDYLFVSGEKAMPQHMYGDSDVFEFYGASECPTMLANPLGQGGPAVLGKPFKGVTAFLKDENGQTITEPDTIGELCIISPYMATEYHNMPEETSKKFSHESGKQVYHTGDYMAYDLNGDLVFHGRKDRMVKIRGQRVELDEIDNVMCRCDGINESKTVEVNVQNAARLCCYYIGRIFEQKELKKHAEKYLADYMIPDYFIHLEEMPRNARGKADLQALKQRKIDAVSLRKKTSAEHSTGEFAEPNVSEKRIQSVFAEVLDLPSVDPDDEFSEIGGTSMLAMQAVANLNDLNITMKDIFALKTPRRLAEMVQSRDSNTIEQRIQNVFAEVLDLPSVDPDDEFSEIGGTSMLAMQAVANLNDLNITMKDIFALKTPRRLAEALMEQSALQAKTELSAGSPTSYPLLPYQRYYVDYQLYTPKGDGTNVPILKAMPRSEIEPEELKRAVDTVLHHFSIFGMIFTFADEGFVQRYAPERIQPVEIINTSDNVFKIEILPHLLKPHKVINSLMYRCAIYVTETTVYLFMDFHHSIIDGTSISLVIKNIIRVLHGEPPEKDLYFEFLRQHEIFANRKEAEKELERLKKIYNLPSFERMPRVDHQSRDNQIHILKVPFSYSFTDLMDALQGKSISLGMLYSTAGLLAMKEYNNTDKVQVQWIYNGRDEPWKENIIGITMSAHPIAIDFSRPELNLMKEVSAQIIDSIIYSDLSFALYDNSPSKQETINMICEDGIEINTSITPGSYDIPMWDYRVTSPAAAECVLYPAKKENQLIMFINYNKCIYDEASMERFGRSVADCMMRLAKE
ncbi:MAG: non-ribosomal peptide synthetase [Solobacterium sp.]|nr:non-ribosomal peptide synthetase [Solobacterium sp.]